MKRVMLTVAYDGSAYSGWQLQPNADTIEGQLNKRLSESQPLSQHQSLSRRLRLSLFQTLSRTLRLSRFQPLNLSLLLN